jgi:hypothetical protein
MPKYYGGSWARGVSVVERYDGAQDLVVIKIVG